MATVRFRPPKTEKEEILLLSETVPKNTKYNTKWAVNVFTAWQNTRMNKKAQLETSGGNGLESTNVEDLSVPLEHMSADSLNFWLCKFICEVAKQTGERYPPKTLYLLVCGINRHLGNVQGEKAFNIMEKSDRRVLYSEWQKMYWKLTDMVVPESSRLVFEDNEHGLYTVTLFKKVVDEFKVHARDKKFLVREFVYDEQALEAGKNEITKLESDKKKQFGPLVRWLRVNFSDSFIAWIHVKALRVFVESVLRYGLPVNFQAMLLQPSKKSHKKIKDMLDLCYQHLDNQGFSSTMYDAHNLDIPGLSLSQQEYYPYVFYQIKLDLIER